MPSPVNINILKEWFSNLKKPPQEQFWAWLDSFRHKWEKVPLDDVDGLRGILNKKADLVNGVVPEEQLPFSVVTSEVIALGAVTVTDKINLAVHSSGANKVRVKGRMIIRSFPNQWDFTEFNGNGIKVIRGYAVKSEDDFFIAEGDELPTYSEPPIPENALQIFKITISVNGIVIDESSQYGSKMKADDQWTNAYLDVEEGDYLSVQNQPSSFNLIIAPTIVTPKLFGVMTVRVFTDEQNFAWDGKEFLLYTERDVLLTTQEGGDPVAALPFVEGTNYTSKAGTYTRLKLRNNKVIIIESGGSASFPEIGNDGDVLERDSTLPDKVKWVAKLKGSTNKMLHYWDAGSWLNSGVEFISTGIIKVRSIVLTTSTGTALPNELGTDGTSVWFGVAKKKLAYEEQIIKFISANTIIDDSFHNAIVIITATCTVTLPLSLRSDLNFVCRTYNTATATFSNPIGSTTISSQSNGVILSPSSMCSVVKIATNSYLISGTE